MCLLILAHQISPQYPLLVAANRDEFHARPTSASNFWAAHPALLAGRDLKQGGTWMGVTRDGRFGAVTNYRDPSRTIVAPRSRGELSLGYLTGTLGAQTFLSELMTRAQEYAGFNLLIGDRHSLWYFTNSDDAEPQCLLPGIYGLSNARLDTPWPKVERGKARMEKLLAIGSPSHDALATVVADRRLADQLTVSEQDLDHAMAPELSAQFIVTDTYGTRSSTTVWTDNNAQTHWREQSFNAHGTLGEVQQKVFNLSGD